MNGELGCRDTRGAMGRANEVTVIVLRKPDAIMAGLSCLGSLGFSGYIAQKVLEDEVPIDACAVALGVVALVAGTAVVAGGILAGMKGIRAIGRHLFARRLA